MGVWQMACRRVIKVGERVVKDLIASTFRSSFLPNASPNSVILIDSSHSAEAKVEAERPSDEKSKQT